ncbi:hypothetical protein WN51_12941 [Melipona quadrifasciata]|uniref:Uncharacterized protein n=1 Tax=Melipona quadrifasciata TaxID=166423 RepID=A0A0N0U7E4_9HYME|nr:hypothetical protein WN51_12941 [Melipona quadrifasciata]
MPNIKPLPLLNHNLYKLQEIVRTISYDILELIIFSLKEWRGFLTPRKSIYAPEHSDYHLPCPITTFSYLSLDCMFRRIVHETMENTSNFTFFVTGVPSLAKAIDEKFFAHYSARVVASSYTSSTTEGPLGERTSYQRANCKEACHREEVRETSASFEKPASSYVVPLKLPPTCSQHFYSRWEFSKSAGDFKFTDERAGISFVWNISGIYLQDLKSAVLPRIEFMK